MNHDSSSYFKQFSYLTETPSPRWSLMINQDKIKQTKCRRRRGPSNKSLAKSNFPELTLSLDGTVLRLLRFGHRKLLFSVMKILCHPFWAKRNDSFWHDEEAVTPWSITGSKKKKKNVSVLLFFSHSRALRPSYRQTFEQKRRKKRGQLISLCHVIFLGGMKKRTCSTLPGRTLITNFFLDHNG